MGGGSVRRRMGDDEIFPLLEASQKESVAGILDLRRFKYVHELVWEHVSCMVPAQPILGS